MIYLTAFSLQDMERFIGKYSLGRDNGRGSYHFLRFKVIGSSMTSDQFRGVAELSEKYGRGYAEVTNRQNIQLHWIEADDALDIFSMMDELGFCTDMCGQGFKGARYGDVRNIVTCPLNGVARNEVIDPCPLVRRLSDLFIGNKDFLDLPKKFKIAMTGCQGNCIKAEVNDLTLLSTHNDGREGFTAYIGGGVGPTLPGPRMAKPFDIFIEPDEVVEMTKAMVEIFRENGNRENKAKARFKNLLEEWGIERFKGALEEKIGRKIDDGFPPPPLVPEDHIGIEAQKQEGLYSVTIPLIGGILSSEGMYRIAEAAERFGSESIRVMPTQNIALTDVGDVKALSKYLDGSGFSLEGSRMRYTSIACPSDFCGKAIDHNSKDFLRDLVLYLEGVLGDTDGLDFDLSVSGCPNDCARGYIADIYLKAKPLRIDGVLRQGYTIHLGGSMGRSPLKGGVPAGEVRYLLERLLQRYLLERRDSESLRDFCKRHSEEELENIMMEAD